MLRKLLAGCLVGLMVAGSLPAQAEVFKWKDENGKMHFTDDIRKVPKEFRPKRDKSRSTPELKSPASKPSKPSTSYSRKAPSSGGSRQSGIQRSSRSSMKNMNREMEKGFGKMGEEMGKGLAKGMQKMGEEMGKAFQGLGELMAIAAANAPDQEKTSFKDKAEEREYRTKEFLLGMYLFCQSQFILAKSKVCTREGPKGGKKKDWKMKEDPEMKKKFKDYEFEIDPRKNTKKDLLIQAYHKQHKNEVWEITQAGKSSLRRAASKK